MSFLLNCVSCNNKLKRKFYWSKETSLEDPYDDSFFGSSINKPHRWRKCIVEAQRMVDELISDVHELEKEMKYALCKFWEHDKLQDVFPNFVQEMRDTQRSLKVLENVKSTYGHMAANRSNANLIYRNALLFVVVSYKSGAS